MERPAHLRSTKLQLVEFLLMVINFLSNQTKPTSKTISLKTNIPHSISQYTTKSSNKKPIYNNLQNALLQLQNQTPINP